MKISSIRLGFANNSSSSHSILIGCRHGAERSSGAYQFGYENFHLVTQETKYNYLAVCIKDNLPYSMEEELKVAVVEELMGAPYPHVAGGYVDHESVLAILPGYDGKTLEPAYVEYLKNLFSRPDITIAGGSANNGTPDPWMRGQKSMSLPLEESSKALICLPKDGQFIFFNRQTGAKFRIDPSDSGLPYTKSSTPELIDIKITDYCPHGCPFCYQDSTKKGKHAPLELIKELIDKASEAKVLEIAIGGGEPTLHPNFAEILEYARSKHIVPNFTTFNMDFAKNPAMAEAVKKFAGSFAVSSIKPDCLTELFNWNKSYNMGPGTRATVQIPMGCYPKETVKDALNLCYENHTDVTLLGYKDYGRGTNFKAKEYKEILEVLLGAPHNESKYIKFGADTLFVAQFKKELDQLKVSETLRVGQEGQFSCYIDAVAKTMGACSYTDKMHKLDRKDPFKNFPYPPEHAANRFMAQIEDQPIAKRAPDMVADIELI